MNPMERVTTCNGATCGAPIQWEITAAGKRTPVNLDGSPHWATCPDVARFKSSRTKVPPTPIAMAPSETTRRLIHHSPKDDPMTDITKAHEHMGNGKTAKTIDTTPAPKSEASEVIATSAAPVSLSEEEDRVPSVMGTAMKIVKLLEKHRTDEERGRVLLCVVAGSGMSGLGAMASAVRGPVSP